MKIKAKALNIRFFFMNKKKSSTKFNEKTKIYYQDIQLTQPFYLFPNGFINNGNAKRSNSVSSIDQNEKVLINIDVKRSTIDLAENRRTQEPANVLQRSYQIPSPTMTLPTEFSPNLITNSPSNRQKLRRASLTDHLRIHQIFDPADELQHSHDKHSLSTMSSVHPAPSPRYSRSNLTFVSHQLTSSRSTATEKSASPISHFSKEIQHDFGWLNDPSSIPSTPHIDHERELKHERQSLWKNRLTLKTLLAMANRDEAKNFKDRKPIDYQMFLTSKWTNNSLLEYFDTFDKKISSNPNENEKQNFRENRRFFKRILYTMELRKPWNVKKVVARSPAKRRKRKKTFEINSQDDSYLIVYRAVPVSPRLSLN